jgi:3-oxoadipate enol-lactonase
VTLHHRSEGPASAPALVLAGSLGTTLALWDPQIPELATSFRVLRYDHPGHGGSDLPPSPTTVDTLADGLLELIDEVGFDRFSVCGLSLGGMVATALALRIPQRVERLVLCCTGAKLGTADGWLERAELVRERGVAAVADLVLERFFTPGFAAGEPDTVASFRAMLEASSPEGYARCCEALAAWDARDRIHEIAAPTLVVAGADDPAVPPETVELLVERIPRATRVVLSPAAHLANVEQPAAFTRALLDHLRARPTSEEAA